MKKLTAVILVASLVLSAGAFADHQKKCTSDWNTGQWTACVDGYQTRDVIDTNHCGTNKDKPVSIRLCTVPPVCTPNWTCDIWGQCVGGYQWRCCFDSCGGNRTDRQDCTIASVNNTTNDTNTTGNQTIDKTLENTTKGNNQNNFWTTQAWSTQGLVPNSTQICAMNTYMGGTIKPKQIFAACHKNAKLSSVLLWAEQYGPYDVRSMNTYWQYTWYWFSK